MLDVLVSSLLSASGSAVLDAELYVCVVLGASLLLGALVCNGWTTADFAGIAEDVDMTGVLVVVTTGTVTCAIEAAWVSATGGSQL